MEDGAIVSTYVGLWYTPMRVQEVAYVLDIEGQLELVLDLASLEAEVLSETEVELAVLRSVVRVSLSILALVLREVVILLNECPEGITVLIAGELNLILVLRDIDEVSSNTITIHIVVIDV